MTRKEYNGWYNYRTWLFSLHWDSSFTEDTQDAWAFAKADKFFTREEKAALDLADRIKKIAEEAMQESLSGNRWMDDLIIASFSEINFHDIAKHYIEEVNKAEGE